ncbi:hypothetical protein KY285_030514 [Solanum tuberosum]|nr:hypothetical protein KY285_030514 [Solanum tuberosum]
MDFVVGLPRTKKDAKAKAKAMKNIHNKVRMRIEKANNDVTKRANKGRKSVTFAPGYLVWVHFRKEIFPRKRKNKLIPRGDGLFQVLEKIRDNAYKVDLPSVANSRMNSFEEGESDVDQSETTSRSQAKDLPSLQFLWMKMEPLEGSNMEDSKIFNILSAIPL